LFFIPDKAGIQSFFWIPIFIGIGFDGFSFDYSLFSLKAEYFQLLSSSRKIFLASKVHI